MNKEEALEIMELLYATYPNFNKSGMKKFNQIWMDKLMDLGDYRKTLQRANQYITESPYPPSLADIIVKPYKHVDHGMPEQIRAAEERVRKEQADPEIAARRKSKLDEYRKKLERMQVEVSLQHDD